LQKTHHQKFNKQVHLVSHFEVASLKTRQKPKRMQHLFAWTERLELKPKQFGHASAAASFANCHIA